MKSLSSSLNVFSASAFLNLQVILLSKNIYFLKFTYWLLFISDSIVEIELAITVSNIQRPRSTTKTEKVSTLNTKNLRGW